MLDLFLLICSFLSLVIFTCSFCHLKRKPTPHQKCESRFICDRDGYQIECIGSSTAFSSLTLPELLLSTNNNNSVNNDTLLVSPSLKTRALPDLPHSSVTVTRSSSSSELYATVDKVNGLKNGNLPAMKRAECTSSHHTIRKGAEIKVWPRMRSSSTSSSIGAAESRGNTDNGLYSKIKQPNINHVYSKISALGNERECDHLYPPVARSWLQQKVPNYEYATFSEPAVSSRNQDFQANKLDSFDPYSSIRSESHYERFDIEHGGVSDEPGPSHAFDHTSSVRPKIVRSGSETGVYREDLVPLYGRPHRPSNVASFSDDNTGGRHVRTVELNYRYLTVRQSINALINRVASQRPATVTSSDPSSLNYYATISEHNYEMVPYAMIHKKFRGLRKLEIEDATYIDDDYDVAGPSTNIPQSDHVTRIELGAGSTWILNGFAAFDLLATSSSCGPPEKLNNCVTYKQKCRKL